MPGEVDYYEQDAFWDEHAIADPAIIEARLHDTEALLPADAGTVLDVGAGDGRFVRRLAARTDGPAVFALERSRSALGRIGVTGVQASADALPVGDRAVGTVTALEVIEHLPVDVYDRALAELARVADRYVVITVPNRERIEAAHVTCPVCRCRYSPTRHLRSFTPETFDHLLPGFTPHRIAEFGHRAYWYPRVARTSLERIGLLERPGVPQCPQCGAGLAPAPAPPATSATNATGSAPSSQTAAAAATDDGGASLRRRVYRVARRVAPRTRHPYHLACVLRRDRR